MHKVPICLAIHGGAGSLHASGWTPKKEQDYHAVLHTALTAGYAVLKAQGTSLNAVREAVKFLKILLYLMLGAARC